MEVDLRKLAADVMGRAALEERFASRQLSAVDSILLQKQASTDPALIKVAQGVVQAMTGNPHFLNASPSLATVTAQILDVIAAETATTSRTKGAAQARDVKVAALRTSLKQLKSRPSSTLF